MNRIICILTGFILTCSCMRVAMPEAVRVNLLIGQPEAMESTECISTKSYLTATDIETRISSVTLGLFEADGTQAYLAHHTGSIGSIDITLRSDRAYNIYALVNMGDQRSALAAAVSDGTLSSMTYTVNYNSMASAGIPMAGSLSGQSFTEGQHITVPVKRLLARINVSLSCDWAGAVITSATVKNVNPTVSPFGTSPAGNNNTPTLQDIHGTVAGSAPTLSAVFYVPENTQGTVGSIKSSREKTYTNDNLSSIRNYATFLETNVSTTGQYTGSVVYRSYLGANETTDFNILRNRVYDWSISYHADNMMDYDWKRAADVSVIDPSISINPWLFDGSDTDYVGLNNRASSTASYTYTGPASGFTSYASDLTNCTSSDFSYGNDGATVWVYWKSANSSSSARSVSIYLYDPETGAKDYIQCRQAGHTITYIYKVVTTVSSSELYVGGTSSATAKLYRSSDGGSSWTYQSDVTGSGFTAVSGGSHVSISGSTLTGISSGSVTLRSKYSANSYEDANLNIWDYYEMVVSGSTSALRSSSISLTATLRKNGSPVSASFNYSWVIGGSYANVSKSGNVFTISATNNRSCKYNDMDHYTLRIQVYTDAHTGTLSKDVNIVFEPTAWNITIGLRYESGSSFTSTSCTYYAEASEVVPPEAQYAPLIATDNYGNQWAFDSVDHTIVTAPKVNPGGFNPNGNASVAKNLYIVSISPSILYSKYWDANYTFLVGETKAN